MLPLPLNSQNIWHFSYTKIVLCLIFFFFFFLSSLCLIFPNGLQALCGQGAGLIHLCASPPGSVPGTHEALSKRLQGI